MPAVVVPPPIWRTRRRSFWSPGLDGCASFFSDVIPGAHGGGVPSGRVLPAPREANTLAAAGSPQDASCAPAGFFGASAVFFFHGSRPSPPATAPSPSRLQTWRLPELSRTASQYSSTATRPFPEAAAGVVPYTLEFIADELQAVLEEVLVGKKEQRAKRLDGEAGRPKVHMRRVVWRSSTAHFANRHGE